MLKRSLESTAGAPVHTGRAPRRVPNAARSWRRRVRAAVVAGLVMTGLTVLAGLTLVPAAQAHEGADREIAAVLDRVSPEMPGVILSVESTRLGSQFVLENPTPTEVTILSSVGDPLFRVGPEGVLGNFRSPEWYTAKVPSGAVAIPDRAAERGTPVWVRVSEEPAWGWFDHRLHAVDLPPEQKAASEPLDSFGTWTVPVTYGDALGSVDGHFEYRPALGQFTPSISDTTPVPGVTLTVLQGNPVPGIAIDNAGQREVVVLGDSEEPYLRLTAGGAEANALSPTWITSQDRSAQGSRAGDAAAPPEWVPIGGTPQYSFTLGRAGPDADLAGLYAVDRPSVVREWTLSLVVDGERIDVDGETRLTPVGYTGGWDNWVIAGLVLAAAVIVAAVWWFLRRRAAGPRARPSARTPETVGVRR